MKSTAGISVEQAARNLRMINNQPGEEQDAPTRNSNLQCLPKNDKLNRAMQNSQGYSNSYSHKSTQPA